jgi:hypothetical protein
MKTITLELFKFNELSEGAKQTAIDNYRRQHNNDGGAINEIIDSAKAAIELFNLKTGRLMTIFCN